MRKISLLTVVLLSVVGLTACMKHKVVSEEERKSDFCYTGFQREVIAAGYAVVDTGALPDRIYNPFTGVEFECAPLRITPKGVDAIRAHIPKGLPQEE